MRKLLLLLLFAVLLLLLLPVMAGAESSGTCGPNAQWLLNDEGVLTISGSGKINDGGYFDSKNNWKDPTALKEVVIEPGITGIGNYSFIGCTNMTIITIPDSVTQIGQSAFYKCRSLTDVTIPSGVTVINASVFEYCTSLESVYLPENVKSIGSYAFRYCGALSDVTLPDEVTSIGKHAFSECTSLSSLTIPEGVTGIEEFTFSKCSGLTTISIPESVTSIGNSAFSGCSSLTAISIPDNVTAIGSHAFSNCSGLTAITIPEGVTGLGNSAFFGCSSLTAISLPEAVSITYFSCDYAFCNCSSLTAVTIPEGVTRIGDSAFSNCSSLTAISIPDSVTSIGSGSFSGCKSLSGITIPEDVTSIGDYAFNHCSGLTTITLPEGITNIGQNMLSYCSGLTTVTIPEGVTSIGNQAFYNCSGLSSLTIPKGVTSLGNQAFISCSNLKKVCFLKDDTEETTFGSLLFNGTSLSAIYCYEYSSVDSWVAANYPDNLIYISSIEDIRTITLPDDFRLSNGDTGKISIDLFPNDGLEGVVWESSNPDVASVINGTVTAFSPGKAVITAGKGGKSDSMTIYVYTPATGFELPVEEAWLIAKESIDLSNITCEPAEAEVVMTWTSSDTSLATVDETGLVTTKIPGDVTITARTEKGIQQSALLHLCYPVTAISFSDQEATITSYKDYQAIAHVTMKTQNCDNHLVSFSSADPDIATIDEHGVVHGISVGTTTITASSSSGVATTMTVHVRDAYVLRLPDDLTEIESEAFRETDAEVIIIPESCQSIGELAFAYCTKLVYVQLPDTEIEIALNAFEGCADDLIIDRSDS